MIKETAFTNTSPLFEGWLCKVYSALEELTFTPRSELQGLVEPQAHLVERCYDLGLDAEKTAPLVASKSEGEIAKGKQFPWADNRFQFPRVIEEAFAAGAFTSGVLEKMAESMDLCVSEVEELIQRAEREWDGIKEGSRKVIIEASELTLRLDLNRYLPKEDHELIAGASGTPPRLMALGGGDGIFATFDTSDLDRDAVARLREFGFSDNFINIVSWAANKGFVNLNLETECAPENLPFPEVTE